MADRPLASVVVLNMNGRRLLGACLAGLAAQTFRAFETIVVDNGSTDGSAEFVAQTFPWVRLVRLSRNLGFCRGNNAGLRAARGRYVALLNNDAVPEPGWLGAMVEAMAAERSIGIVAPKMLRLIDPGVIDNCGIGLSATGAGYQRGALDPDDGRWNEPEDCFGASGGACLLRRAMLDEIGLLDPIFFYSNEDVDLSFRARLAGWRCRFVPAARVLHLGSATAGIATNRTLFLIQRNQELTYFKCMPTPLIAHWGWLHGLYAVGWLLWLAVRGHGRIALLAKLDAIRLMPRTLRARRRVQRQRRLTWREIARLTDLHRVTRLPLALRRRGRRTR